MAAQLPPKSNLWYYTKELGADLCIFSGGKHIKGPQSTGLIVGRPDLLRPAGWRPAQRRIGRAFKTGKEELAGFITALEIFVNEEPETGFKRQEAILRKIESLLIAGADVQTEMSCSGAAGNLSAIAADYFACWGKQHRTVILIPEAYRSPLT